MYACIACFPFPHVLISLNSQDFQFFPPGLAQLQEREFAVFKVFLNILANSQFNNLG